MPIDDCESFPINIQLKANDNPVTLKEYGTKYTKISEIKKWIINEFKLNGNIELQYNNIKLNDNKDLNSYGIYDYRHLIKVITHVKTSQYTQMDQTLNDIKLAQYSDTLKNNGYDWDKNNDSFLKLTENNLKNIGIKSLQDITKIMNKINEINSQQNSNNNININNNVNIGINVPPITQPLLQNPGNQSCKCGKCLCGSCLVIICTMMLPLYTIFFPYETGTMSLETTSQWSTYNPKSFEIDCTNESYQTSICDCLQAPSAGNSNSTQILYVSKLPYTGNKLYWISFNIIEIVCLISFGCVILYSLRTQCPCVNCVRPWCNKEKYIIQSILFISFLCWILLTILSINIIDNSNNSNGMKSILNNYINDYEYDLNECLIESSNVNITRNDEFSFNITLFCIVMMVCHIIGLFIIWSISTPNVSVHKRSIVFSCVMSIVGFIFAVYFVMIS